MNSQFGSVSDSEAKKMSTSEAYRFLSNFLHKSRVFVFEIITQYRAIFVEYSDEDDTKITHNEPNPLFKFASNWASSLLYEFKRLLPQIKEGSSLSNILQESMHCGHSLSRVGVDFRALLTRMFELRSLNLFKEIITGATVSLSKNLIHYD